MPGRRHAPRTAAVCVISILFVCVSWGLSAAPAEGALNPLTWILAFWIDGTMIETQSMVNTYRGDILETTESIQNRAIIEQRFDTTMYAHDHRALSGWNRIDPSPITSGALFPDRGTESFLTGRDTVTSADFPGDYRTRAEGLGVYAEDVRRQNRIDMTRLRLYQTDGLEPMLRALLAGDSLQALTGIWSGEHRAMQDYQHSNNGDDLPYDAATTSHTADPDLLLGIMPFGDDINGFVDYDDEKPFFGSGEATDAIVTGPGYRRTVQASGQISHLKNHLMVSIRSSLARQAEAGVKYGHNEQQERADAHFAFEGAVGLWNSQSGTDY